jgi:hypothetical protein
MTQTAAPQANALPNPAGIAKALKPYLDAKANSSYIGCMKSGLVIDDNKSPWFEPQARCATPLHQPSANAQKVAALRMPFPL